MGSLCCCPCVDDFDEYAYPSCSIYRNCNGPTFHRLDGRTPQAGTSLVQIGGDAAEASVGDPHSSMNNEQRYARLQRDGLVSRKMMTHLQEDSHQLTRNASSSGAESIGFSKKRIALEPEEGNKLSRSESTRKLTHGPFHAQSSSEDEDVCPTCLDEYSTENPKITANCSHHFHLGCIYEWLERSESCPICGKEMEFSESP